MHLPKEDKFDSANKYLEEMDKMLSDETEETEFVIDYLIEQFTLEKVESNPRLNVKAKITYYKKVQARLVNLSSKLQKSLGEGKIKGYDDQEIQSSSGIGSGAYLTMVSKDESISRYEQNAKLIENRVHEIYGICEKKISDLEVDLENID